MCGSELCHNVKKATEKSSISCCLSLVINNSMLMMCLCFLPKGSIVQCRVSILILDLDGAIGLQQGLHHLHVALVSCHLQRRLALVLDIHLP